MSAPRCGILAAWTSTWLAGRAASDEVLRAVTAGDEGHRIVADDAAEMPLSEALIQWRTRGANVRADQVFGFKHVNVLILRRNVGRIRMTKYLQRPVDTGRHLVEVKDNSYTSIAIVTSAGISGKSMLRWNTDRAADRSLGCSAFGEPLFHPFDVSGPIFG